MHVLVLGGGVIGVTTAWYLRQAGHSVTLVERQPLPAQETSFANGGQISVSHPEPWANPSAPGTVVRWLGRSDAPLLWHWRADGAQWLWGLAFLRACLPAATTRHTTAIAHLATYSLSALNGLRSELSIENDHATRGILHLFKTPKLWAEAQHRMPILQALGIPVTACDLPACCDIEPALAQGGQVFSGGLYAPEDQSGDAARFTQGVAEYARRAGVDFRFDTVVARLLVQQGRVVGAEVRNPHSEPDSILADATVVCLGSYSPGLVRPLGIRLPIYPVKGYSMTVPVTVPERAPMVSLTDETRRIVCSRLGGMLRVAGTAELNGFNLDPNPERSAGLLAWLGDYFPGCFDAAKAEPWCGLRPMTPSGVPVIGESAVPGLFLNTGHGTLGWTLACGSALALAALMSGKARPVDFPFLSPR